MTPPSTLPTGARPRRAAPRRHPSTLLAWAAVGLAAAAAPAAGAQTAAPAPVVHSMCDLSQQFTFHMDGRFARQYLGGQDRDQRNWGTLHKLRLEETNLLVLGPGERRIPYSERSIDHVVDYVRSGGGLLVMADGAPGTEEFRVPVPVAALVERFDARLGLERAAGSARGIGALATVEVEFRGGRSLELGDDWEPLVVDGEGRPILARRDFVSGHVLLGSRGLFGSKPDASDPINAEWVTPLLHQAVKGKQVDPERRQRGQWAELTEQLGPLTLEFTEGTAPFARAIAEEYEVVRPHLMAITGVDPAPGMLKTLLILPTGGGGFSSGQRIAIGAFWGDFPERRYPMLELIAHEAGHSWVLPHPEPLWNEPIATWLGIKVGQRMGLDEADRTLQRAIDRARALDPELDSLDPLADGAARDLIWGKSYFVFEELERLHGPDAMAKYFRTKRSLVPADHARYSFDDCVAVWSAAVGEDLFPWFDGLGFDVDPSRSSLKWRAR